MGPSEENKISLFNEKFILLIILEIRSEKTGDSINLFTLRIVLIISLNS